VRGGFREKVNVEMPVQIENALPTDNR